MIDKWFRIGVQLGLSESKLRQIGADYHTVDMCFAEVISFWLNGNTTVAMSWKSLVEVLESPFVDEKGLAKRLREKGGMVESAAAERGVDEVQSQEINGGHRGKKRSAEEKLDDDRDKHQGMYMYMCKS